MEFTNTTGGTSVRPPALFEENLLIVIFYRCVHGIAVFVVKGKDGRYHHPVGTGHAVFAVCAGDGYTASVLLGDT